MRNDTTMTTGFAVDAAAPSTRAYDLGATWHGPVGEPAGQLGRSRSGLPRLFQLARTGPGLQGPARVSASPALFTEAGKSTSADESTGAGKGTRVPGSGEFDRDGGERFIEQLEATPRYGAPGQCPRRNSGPAE